MSPYKMRFQLPQIIAQIFYLIFLARIGLFGVIQPVDFSIGIYILETALRNQSYFLVINLSVSQLKKKILFFHLQGHFSVKKLVTNKKLKSERNKQVMRFKKRN